jgi:hypothetical protein
VASHSHIGGMTALITFLTVIALFGTLHLLAISRPESKLSQAWIGLGF